MSSGKSGECETRRDEGRTATRVSLWLANARLRVRCRDGERGRSGVLRERQSDEQVVCDGLQVGFELADQMRLTGDLWVDDSKKARWVKSGIKFHPVFAGRRTSMVAELCFMVYNATSMAKQAEKDSAYNTDVQPCTS